MSTDIRQQKKDIAASKAAALAAQTAAQAAQGTATNAVSIGQAAQLAADTVSTAVQTVVGTVETLSVEMVRKFTSQPIEAAAFILDAVRGYYYATVSHGLGDAAPDVEVYDNDKDKQRMQSLIVDNNTIELELDAEDLASNSFPLTCIVLGKNTPVQPVIAWLMTPGSGREFGISSQIVYSRLVGTIEADLSNLFVGVVNAFLQGNRLYVELVDGSFHYKEDGLWTDMVILQPEYAAAMNNSIQLSDNAA